MEAVSVEASGQADDGQGREAAAEATSAASNTPLTGFWRRLAAFVMDWIILALVGNVLALVLFDPLAALGGWARVVGFVVALGYFGLFDSAACGAGTPGKRVAGLRVVDGAGRGISLPRSFMRAALLAAPFLFNGMIVTMADASMAERVFAGLMGGWAVAALYFAACNRVTRQALHDVALGTFVVYGEASRRALEGLAFWRPHMLVVLLLLVAGVPCSMAGLPIFLRAAPGTWDSVTEAPAGVPQARAGWIFFSPATGPARICDRATIMLRGAGVDDERVARQFAGELARRFHCRVEGKLSVRLYYGFDIGFAAGRKYRDFVLGEDAFADRP